MKNWIARRYASYTAGGKVWLTIGITCMIVDMAIGFQAGYSVATFWHGVGYAALAVGFAFMPDAAYEEFEGSRYASAAVIGLLCLPIGLKAYEQQLTYSAGMRSGEMQTVGWQNTKADGAQDDVNRARKELDALTIIRDKAMADNAWIGTVKAEGLRAQLAAAQKAIDLETARGGCKSKCLALMEKKGALEKDIATAEKFEGGETRIAELQAIIDKKREVANKTEHRQSLNVDIAKTTARLVKLAMGEKPEAVVADDSTAEQFATLGSAGLGSLALLLLAPIGMFLAGRRRIPGYTEPTPVGTLSPSAIAPEKQEARAYPPIRPVLEHVTIAQLRAIAQGRTPHAA